MLDLCYNGHKMRHQNKVVLRSKLEELSSNLSEEERRELLAKIKGSLEGSDGEFYVAVELEEAERKQLITQEIGRLSLWKRFLLWLMRLLTGREKDQAFISLRLGEIKRSIQRRTPGLSGFETRDLTVKFIRYVYDLYFETYPLKEFFHYYANEAGFKEELVYELIAERYEKAKNALADFLDIVELETIFAETSSQQEIQKMLSKRFEEYIKNLPSSLLERIEMDLAPVVAMKNVVLYNFKELFQPFDYYLPPELDKKYPVFRAVPALVVIDHLERLYYAIYTALKAQEKQAPFNPHLLMVYVLHKQGFDRGKNAKEIERHRNEIDQEVAFLKSRFEALTSQILQFYETVPLLELIRYFRRDPFYRLRFYIPPLPLRQIYAQYLRKKIDAELNQRLNEIKDRVIERKVQQLFKETPMLPLNYYNDKASDIFYKIGLPYFSHIRSLTLLYNYINKIYREFIQQVVELVSPYFFANNKRNQNKLLQFASALEEVEDKIIWFDRSLSPEEDDGKTLSRLKYNIATDLTHQKLYKSFLVEKERDAHNMVEKGIECFTGYKELFDELLNTPTENIQNVLKTIVVWNNKQYTIKQLLALVSLSLGEFLSLLLQVQELEKGR